jgi:hypothetical protein
MRPFIEPVRIPPISKSLDHQRTYGINNTPNEVSDSKIKKNLSGFY